ncbi:hypothetical protein G6F59_018017 [Rhizopus arrhizus]|nr:hypothetical protein G6F59_018017 [Rhizopus arrhizus]
MLHARPLSPAMESLLHRIEQAFNSAEGMAILIGEQYGPAPKPPAPMGYNPKQIATAMIMLIVIAASFLNFVMSDTGLPDALTQSITGLGLSPGWVLQIVVGF